MRAICFALVIINVLAHDHAGKKGFVIKTKKGKSYLADKGEHKHIHPSNGESGQSDSDYALG